MHNNEDVEHQDLNIYCATNHFTEFPCYVPHNKTHGVSGLVKNYHACFDPKPVHGICGIRCIPCARTQ